MKPRMEMAADFSARVARGEHRLIACWDAGFTLLPDAEAARLEFAVATQDRTESDAELVA